MMVCFQHSGWRRRSLIDDAKFDTVANAEYEKVERVRSSTSNEGEGHDLEQEHDEEEDVFAVPNGNAPASPTSRKQFHLLLSLREMAALGRLFKLFEVFKYNSTACCIHTTHTSTHCLEILTFHIMIAHAE